MALTDFTDPSDPNDPNGNAPGGPAGPGGGLPMTPAAQPGSDAEDLLINYNDTFASAEPTPFRDTLIQQTLSVMISRSKPNVLLVGPAGVGKTRIVEDIARRIAVGDSLIPDRLREHTVYELPVTAIIAGSGVVGDIEAKTQAVIDFASDPKNKAILFIDEIHQIVGSTRAPDPALRKISQILKPALARGAMSVIGATTTNEARGMDEDPAFARRFSRLVVDELTIEQTKDVLTAIRPGLIAHYHHEVGISDDVLEKVVDIAETHSRAGQHRPDKAITLLDRAMSDRVLEQKTLIRTAEADGDHALATALRSVPQTPLTARGVTSVAQRLMTGNATANDLDVATLHQRLTSSLIGQDRVLNKLVKHLARRQLDLFPSSVPTTWMLAGTSGVGKTESAKIIAEELTDQEPIVLNMAEYSQEWSKSQIMGSPPGYVGSTSDSEKPFDTLESNPHRVILLDEFEKADTSIQRLFLSAFDQGYILDAQGHTIDFSKALIICTTNAARDSLRPRATGFGSAPERLSHKTLNDALATFFDPELLGRFSLVVGFDPIDRATYESILRSTYVSQRAHVIGQRPRLGSQLPTDLPDEEVTNLVASTFVESQGARPIRRAVRAWIEDYLSAPPTSPVTTAASYPAPAVTDGNEELGTA